VAERLMSLTGYKGKVVIGSYPPGYPQRPKSQDPAYLVLDSSRIVNDLGWRPKYSLEDGLKITVDMWKSEIKR